MDLKIVREGVKPLGLVWIDCPYPVLALGLERTFGDAAEVYFGVEPPGSHPRCAIVCSSSPDEIEQRVRAVRIEMEDTPIVVFGMTCAISLVRAALKAGARGFVHSGMEHGQIVRAVSVAIEGEVVVPRELLRELVVEEAPVDVENLTQRQIEILKLVLDGKTNAQIGRDLYLSESTIKQHLRAAFKSLKVRNRTEAAKLLRDLNVDSFG